MGNLIYLKRMFYGIGMMLFFMATLMWTDEVNAMMLPDNYIEVTDEKYFVFDSVTGMITQYTGNDAEVVVPEKIGGQTVKGFIGTFNNNKTITSVKYPENISVIGDYTFNGCEKLSKVYPYLTTDIEDRVFVLDPIQQLGVVPNVACISETVTTIGKQAFGGKNGMVGFDVDQFNPVFTTTEDGVCLLSKVFMNDVYVGLNLVRFASGYTCNNGYTLPEGLYSVGSYAFEDIHNDGHLTFPKSIQVISDYGFYRYGMIDNNFIFPEDCALHTIGSYGFTYNRKLQIKFPKNLKVIGSYFCSYNENVAIDISETQIETIPEYAFADCSALHELVMPATVKHILAYAFTNCNNLSTIKFLGDELLTLAEGAFKDCPTLHVINIPEGVKNIEDETFSGCGNLCEVVLPDSVEKIGKNAFKDCVTIHTLVIPPNVTYIDNTSFDGVDQTKIDTSKNECAQKVIKGALPEKGTKRTSGKLIFKVTKSHKTKGTVSVVKAINKKQKKIIIPNKVYINGYSFAVTAIEKNAFLKNGKLSTVQIGSKVTSIGSKAFYNCKKLKTITVKSKVIKTVKSNAFKGIHKNAKIKLPKMKKSKFNKYKKKFMKKGQAKSVKIK